MNSMYNEIYGLYYFMLERILGKASKTPITLKEIHQIVSQYGFNESNLYFTPDVISQKEGYYLLKESSSGYTSVLNAEVPNYITSLQRGFIKSILYDKKIHLFFEDEMLQELRSAFYDTAPLFQLDDFILTETALDSDDYLDEKYICNFKILLSAIQKNQILRVCFNNSKGKRTTMKIVPYKLEYGVRDDKFRLCGVSVYGEKCRNYMKINLARILSISVLAQSFSIDFEAFIAKRKKQQPIEIEVYDLRNGFERVFIALSNYERISTFDDKTGKCTIKIYYYSDDEPELLIQLLSFGPAIKVLGPEDFKKQFIERIKKQIDMLNKP